MANFGPGGGFGGVQDGNRDFSMNKNQFKAFLNPDHGAGRYAGLVNRMLEYNKTRLTVNLNDLRDFTSADDGMVDDDNLGDRLLDTPMYAIPPFEEALKEYIVEQKEVSEDKKHPSISYRIAVEGSFGSHLVVPRDLNAALLTKLVCIEGIVTKLSLVRPKIMKSVHFCESTQKFTRYMYRDATSFTGAPTSSVVPSKDDQGNDLTQEYGLSLYTNHQKVFVQDMPERSAAGQMPRTVEVIVEGDLVDACKPGDRVQVIGVYRALAHRAEGTTSGMYRTVCIANNIRTVGAMAKEESMAPEDVAKIRKVAKREDLFELFSRSLAASLFGHQYIKKALTLLLFGGVEKTLENGTHLRGDINMLLVGDPSVGKSQLLRCVMHVAKLAISTTGRGATGVGLTAAVVTDKDTGDRYLEAGAMVLGDRGIVCIDEFDKMSIVDRTAMHEVMEQQTVTVAKAGIHTSLNARCSVVAAANPIYGSYDTSKPPQKNIPLPDSILSRFDFLFIVLDKLDPNSDRRIADHVLRMHRFKTKSSDVNEHDIYDADDADNEDSNSTEIYQKYDRLLHGASADVREGNQRRVEYLTLDFIKKYIDYAKKRYAPTLTDEASECIATAYGDLRTKEETQTLPITARCLETMIRLSSAHAKLRLSKNVEERDVEVALEILQYSLNNEAQVKSQRKPTKKKRISDDSDYSGSDDDSDNDSDAPQPPPLREEEKSPSSSSKKRGREDVRLSDGKGENSQDPEEEDGDTDTDGASSGKKRGAMDVSDDTSHKKQKTDSQDPFEEDEEPEDEEDEKACVPPASPSVQGSSSAKTQSSSSSSGTAMDTTSDTIEVTKERKKEAMRTIVNIFKRTRKESMRFDELLPELNKKADKEFSSEELEAILAVLENDNRIMFRKGTIQKI